MYGIHSNFLDFLILPTNDTKILVFVDASEYMQDPESPLLEIILPGADKYLLVNILPRRINTFNSNSLGITPQTLNECGIIDLPDGVWTFKYKICPYQYINRIKYYLRTETLSQKLNCILDKIDYCEVEEKVKQEVIDIMILKESAEASAELAQIERASSKYDLANKKATWLLDKLTK